MWLASSGMTVANANFLAEKSKSEPFILKYLDEEPLPVSLCRKLKKSCNDVAEGLGALSLEETSGATQSQKLSALEQIFSFASSHPTQFPQTHCQQFTQQMKDLPAGNYFI